MPAPSPLFWLSASYIFFYGPSSANRPPSQPYYLFTLKETYNANQRSHTNVISYTRCSIDASSVNLPLPKLTIINSG